MTLLAPNRDLIAYKPMLIGDAWSDPRGGAIHRHVYAGNGEATVDVGLAGAADVDAAVAAARDAFPAWRALAPARRRDILLRCAELLRRDGALIGQLETIDNASPVRAARGSAGIAADWLAYNAGWAERIHGQTLHGGSASSLDYVEAEPFGVIGVIIPWNGPVVSMGMVLGPALAAGNCAVVKPPELAPFAVRHVAQLFLEAGVPPGVVNIVTGGPEAGRALVQSRGVDKIHFTGSPATARHILRDAAQNITPCAMELGGKSANVIFADADLDAAVPHAMQMIIGKSGQGCIRGTRLLVEDAIYDEVIARCAAIAAGVVLGDPLDEATTMGPVINEAACERIVGMIDRARADGARLVAGGARAGGELLPGFYVQPTVFGDVDPHSELAQQEVFGPVLAITRFSGEEQAIELANSTDYALAGYVRTADAGRAHRVARAINAGNVWVNGFCGILPNAPFGGNGISGFGRLGGEAGVREFLRERNIWLQL